MAAHGMDIAQMFERLWFVIFDPLVLVRVRVRLRALTLTLTLTRFVIFDPLVAERMPSRHPECYTDAALAEGPVRCGEARPIYLPLISPVSPHVSSCPYISRTMRRGALARVRVRVRIRVRVRARARVRVRVRVRVSWLPHLRLCQCRRPRARVPG